MNGYTWRFIYKLVPLKIGARWKSCLLNKFRKIDRIIGIFPAQPVPNDTNSIESTRAPPTMTKLYTVQRLVPKLVQIYSRKIHSKCPHRICWCSSPSWGNSVRLAGMLDTQENSFHVQGNLPWILRIIWNVTVCSRWDCKTMGKAAMTSKVADRIK